LVVAKRRSKRGVNVSAAIREYLKTNPDAGPTEAAKAISEQLGQTVSAMYVSNIKSTSKGKGAEGGQKRRGRPRGPRPAMASVARLARSTNSNGNVDLAMLESMKQIVSRVGASTARRMIDLLA
jgi:ribosomal protein L3